MCVDLQALLVLIKRQPPDGRKLLVVGTSSRGECVSQPVHQY